MRNGVRVALVAGCVGCWSSFAVVEAAGQPSAVRDIVQRVMADEVAGGEIQAGRDRLRAVSDAILLGAAERELEAAVPVELAARVLADAMWMGEGRSQRAMLELADRPQLAAAMVLLLRREPEAKDRVEAYRTLTELIEARPEEVEEFPDLAAAVAAVHDIDTGFHRRLNENEVYGPEAIEVFDFFYRSRRGLAIDPKRTPAELLVFVVDVTSPIVDLRWAQNAYQRTPDPGLCFFEVDYDFDHFKRGAVKRVTASGYDLPSIKANGGVCIDQAYYAAEVGKAWGVPTAIVSARGAEMGHAWIGYLDMRRTKGWNFDEGRYEAYQGLRGNLEDPVTNRTMSDADLNLLSDGLRSDWEERAFAGALAMAVERWRLAPPGDSLALPGGIEPAEAWREPGVESSLWMLEQALTTAPFDTHAWDVVVRMIEEGLLSEEQVMRWAGVLDRLCGTRYPDYAVETLGRIIATFDDDVERQSDMWDWAFGEFGRGRADISSEVRFRQAELWLEAGNADKAWKAYEDVVNRFANESPHVVAAVRAMLRMLDEAGEESQRVVLLAKTWRKLDRPSPLGPFVRGGNWYRIGRLLESEYLSRDRMADARRVGSQLDQVPDGGP
jgi:hypothetical protein